MVTQLFEVAIAVKDLDAATKKYSDVLGVQAIPIGAAYFPVAGLRGVVFPMGNNMLISLIASEQLDTPVAKFVESNGEGIFLIGLEVTDIEQDMRELSEKGVRFVSDKPLPYAAGRINFAHPKSMHGVQIAFAEHEPDYYENFIRKSSAV